MSIIRLAGEYLGHCVSNCQASSVRHNARIGNGERSEVKRHIRVVIQRGQVLSQSAIMRMRTVYDPARCAILFTHLC
jgi:hypothetical protein